MTSRGGLRRRLRSLELPHNPILDAGAAALGHALASNSSLRALSMPFTGLGDGACAALAHALRHGAALESLDVAGNRLSANGVTELTHPMWRHAGENLLFPAPVCLKTFSQEKIKEIYKLLGPLDYNQYNEEEEEDDN